MLIDAAVTLERAFPGSAGWTRKRVYGGTHEGTSMGAELWSSASGQLVVVKHHPSASLAEFEAIARRIGVLRAAGVPAPATTVAAQGSDVLLIHEYLRGRSDPEPTATLVDDLVEIVDREAGLADESAAQWPELMRRSLTAGLDGYNEHASLRSFSDASRALLARVHLVGRDPALGRLPAPDLVHYDLHTVNVLCDDHGRVSGIIDWDGVRAGDRAIDLAKLAFTSLWKTSDPAVYERVWNAFLSSSSHDARVVVMHHVAFGQVDWVLRHPGLAPGPERTIELATWALAVTEKSQFIQPS